MLAWSGAPILGFVWLTRIMGNSLGNNIREMQSNVLVVASHSGVAVTMRH